ncbi:unnamed protein product [Lathyrus oleraceus]|uniref:Micronuclear linker histone polyprotein-like protein n=1 Tax=Pisum sativum TaxID=3888 RepID=A0A9D4VW54_PEA|nr:uncharacterized protein LOC127103362 [Pisum sativum]KAI5389821.1 hypothetical protein KIW84_075215 [Pisum sativum]
MGYNKGFHHNGVSQKGRPYLLILLMTFGAALFGVMVLHRFREKRIFNLLVKQKDHQLITLQLLLQKEKDRTKELSRKNQETKAKIYTLSSQKMELARTIAGMKSTMNSLKDEQKLIESAFVEQQHELRRMQKRGSNLERRGFEKIASRENQMKKEAEKKDTLVKTSRLSIYEHPTTIYDQILAENANATAEAQGKTQNDNQEKDENSKYEGDEDRSKLTEFKDGKVTAETQEESKTNDEQEKKNDNPEDNGTAAKDIDAEVLEDKKAIIEEHQRKLEMNTDGERRDFNVKQLSGEKRKQDHLSKTKRKHRRTIVENKLMENNGISESHGEVNMSNRKVYREENNGTVVRDSDEERDGNNQREAESQAKLLKTENHENSEDDSNNQREAESQAKLLKPENHENSEDDSNKTVGKTNLQVTDNGINNYKEEHEDGTVQQNLSRRHINNAEQQKSNIFHEKSEEFEVSDLNKQEKDTGDDGEEDNTDNFLNETQPDFEDESEKEEYKEEIDESEFQSGL